MEQTAEIMTVSKKFSQTRLPSAIGQTNKWQTHAIAWATELVTEAQS